MISVLIKDREDYEFTRLGWKPATLGHTKAVLPEQLSSALLRSQCLKFVRKQRQH